MGFSAVTANDCCVIVLCYHWIGGVVESAETRKRRKRSAVGVFLSARRVSQNWSKKKKMFFFLFFFLRFFPF